LQARIFAAWVNGIEILQPGFSGQFVIRSVVSRRSILHRRKPFLQVFPSWLRCTQFAPFERFSEMEFRPLRRTGQDLGPDTLRP